MGIQDILQFVKLTHEFQKVERMVYINGEDRRENDVEHSYQLAMVAWYIVDSKKLSLDKNLIIKYALVHDFVEVYAGDTYFYRRSEKEEKDKNKREVDARERLIKEYPEFKEFCDLMVRYELREDEEGRFVYALDKILPILNIYLDGGRSWKADNVTLDMLITGKKDKVAVSNEIKPYFDELVEILSKEKSFFHETKQDK